MGQGTRKVALGLWILGFAGTVSADEPQQKQLATLMVLVVNQAGVHAEVLRAAEKDAAAIFAGTGVHVVWLDQGAAGNEPFDVTVKIAAGMKPSALPRNVDDLSLGFAAVKAAGEGLRGKLVWVFFDQVEIHAERHHVDISRLCGFAMAHEIGHLLLPAGHSDRGVMQATWDLHFGLPDHFTEPQAGAMRTRLAYSQTH